MDIFSYFLLFVAAYCLTMTWVSYNRQSNSNKRFEERMRKLGFAPDGSRLRNSDEILSTENQEVRSALIEKWDGTDLHKIDSDKTGDLFITISSPLRKFVRVINSTAEPDGSFKTYWLRVPANISKAKEAVAWTFGVDANEYNPTIET